MKLTDVQKQNISRMESGLALEILHECAENLGLVSVKEYCEIMQANKRTVYSHIASNKIQHTRISEHIYIIINE